MKALAATIHHAPGIPLQTGYHTQGAVPEAGSLWLLRGGLFPSQQRSHLAEPHLLPCPVRRHHLDLAGVSAQDNLPRPLPGQPQVVLPHLGG